MPRNRAAAIIVREKNVLVMKRNRDDRGDYYTFAGGGVEDGETPEAAVVREVDEETSLTVKVSRELFRVTHANGDVHYYYLCDYISGEPAVREGTSEYRDNQEGRNMFEPLWLAVAEAATAKLYPQDIRDEVVRGVNHGWKSERLDLTSDYRDTGPQG